MNRLPEILGGCLAVTWLVAVLSVAAPLVADAQPVGRPPARVGYLGTANATTTHESLEAFRQGMRDLGWVEGHTVTIEYRWAEGKVERLPALANELVRLGSDVIVVSGSAATRAARQATSSIPIVISAILIDPVAAGFVASLARPGGNITGLASQYEEVITKQVQLLTELVPSLSRLVLLREASIPAPAGALTPIAAARAAAENLGLKARPIEAKNPAEFEGAFRTSRAGRAQAMLVLPSLLFYAERRKLVQLAARYRLPAMYEFREYVDHGGLISYGVSITEMFRRSASYVDRILKGAKPSDLPIERPAKFELVINLKTAKTLGLMIPASVLARADQIIE